MSKRVILSLLMAMTVICGAAEENKSAKKGEKVSVEENSPMVLTTQQIKGMLGANKCANAIAEWLWGLSEQQKQEFLEMYRANAMEAGKFAMTKLEEKKAKYRELDQLIRMTGKKMRQAKTEKERLEYAVELRVLLRRSFEARSRDIAINIAVQEYKLARIKKDYEDRVNNQEKLIDERFERMKKGGAQGRKNNSGAKK